MTQRFLATKTEYSLVTPEPFFVVDMAGVEQDSVSNEEFIEKVERYECIYHRNSWDFKDKNKKVNCWRKWGRNFIYRWREVFKTVLKLTMTSLKDSEKKFPPWRPPCSLLRFSRQHNACVILTLLALTEMYTGNSPLCDRLRLSAITWKQLSLRSFTTCDLRYAIVSCDCLRWYGNTLLRSSAIVTMFYLLRSLAIVCNQLRSCDHMETKVLRSAIKTYPIIFWILAHDSTLFSCKARNQQRMK